MKNLTLIFAMGLLLACSPTTPLKENLLSDVFDTSDYIDSFIKKGGTYSVIKTTNYNSTQKKEEFTNYDISADLEIIRKIDINNPNWLHKYSLDTSYVSDQLIKNYRALDSELKIHQLSTTYDNAGNVIGFEAFINRDALISSSERQVKFFSNNGYSILDKSTPLLGDKKEFGIEVLFKSN